MMRSIAHWAPIALLVGLSVLGLQSAIDELGSASTRRFGAVAGQQELGSWKSERIEVGNLRIRRETG
jgi:hypothetical protein